MSAATRVSAKVRVFGAMKDHFPAEFTVDLGAGSTVAGVVAELRTRAPESAALLESCCFALNGSMVAVEATIGPGAELDVMPPFSGG